jgi:hypothetical protein
MLAPQSSKSLQFFILQRNPGITHSLGQWAALSNGDLVTILNPESRRNVSGDVLVALLVSLVLWNVVEVVTADDEGSVHLGGDDNTAEDTATDRHETGEWALLVCKKTQKPDQHQSSRE